MDLGRRYPFNLPWRGAILGAVFFFGLSVLMAHLARDDTGVIYICLIAVSVIFAFLGTFMITRRFVFPRVLELREDVIVFPHGFPRTRVTRMPYADIIRIIETKFSGRRSLSIITGRGDFEIGDSHLPDFESYLAVRDFICSQAAIVMPHYQERESRTGREWHEFPKPILRWMEPKDWPLYRTNLVAAKPLLSRLAKALWFFVRCFGILMLPWLLLRLFWGSDMVDAAYPAGCVFVTIFFTSLHWLNVTYPVHTTEISFQENGITQFFGKQTMDWNYHDFSGWTVVERQFDGRPLHILLLQGRTDLRSFALPDTQTRDQLMPLLHKRQIPRLPDLTPPWEARP